MRYVFLDSVYKCFSGGYRTRYLQFVPNLTFGTLFSVTSYACVFLGFWVGPEGDSSGLWGWAALCCQRPWEDGPKQVKAAMGLAPTLVLEETWRIKLRDQGVASLFCSEGYFRPVPLPDVGRGSGLKRPRSSSDCGPSLKQCFHPFSTDSFVHSAVSERDMCVFSVTVQALI